MMKLSRNQIDIDGINHPSINRLGDLDRELPNVELTPDAVGWEEVPDGRNLTLPNSNQYESTQNTICDPEMGRSGHVLPMINTEKHNLRSFGSINKKDLSSGAMYTMPSELNTSNINTFSL